MCNQHIIIAKRKAIVRFLADMSAVILSTSLCMCMVAYISATVAPIGVKFCTMVHIGPGHKVSHFGDGIPK